MGQISGIQIQLHLYQFHYAQIRRPSHQQTEF